MKEEGQNLVESFTGIAEISMSIKKKIFITTHDLRLDGAERSLIGLLDSIDYNRFEVDLFILLHTGPLLKLVPEQVNILPPVKKYSSILLPASHVIKYGHIDVLFKKWIARLKSSRFIKKNNIRRPNWIYAINMHQELISVLPEISNVVYDLAISFLNPHFITAQKIVAKKKIAWIHNDYSHFEFDLDTELKMWDSYDYIAAISSDTALSFVNIFPQLRSKVIEIENILNDKFIEEQATIVSVEEEMPTIAGEYKLLSIGRFVHAKNFDSIPEIAHHLSARGHQFKWYLIGFGEVDLVQRKIIEHDVSDKVIILGEKENPYPFINACDIYIQPSRTEGKSVCVREAQILCKPVIITEYPTAQNQVQNTVDGLIVPLDTDKCAQGISEVLADPALILKLQRNCCARDYTNRDEIEKIYSLINSTANV